MPRERKMPLVPEPFDEVAIARMAAAFPGIGGPPIAQTWCRFCPNLNFPEYLRSLSEEKGAELDRRAFALTKRSCINHLYKSSEFGWEVCAWHDVFGLILDDEGLRMFVGFSFVSLRLSNTTTGINDPTNSPRGMKMEDLL